MSLNIPVTLTDDEVAELTEVGQAIYPDATLPELGNWAIAVAKNGLRTEVIRLKAEVIRQQENENRRVEGEEFNTAWPVVPDPLAPDEPEEEPEP